MIFIVGFCTWIIAIFTNIYIYKLLYGKEMCIFDESKIFRSAFIVLLSPFISIALFIKYIILISCEISAYFISHRKKSCKSCRNGINDKCAIYDLNIRKDMLCKGEFYTINTPETRPVKLQNNKENNQSEII